MRRQVAHQQYPHHRCSRVQLKRLIDRVSGSTQQGNEEGAAWRSACPAAHELMLKGTGLALVGIAFPGLALAGAQIYEPLAIEVRAGLQASIADKPAPRHAFADSESAVDWPAAIP